MSQEDNVDARIKSLQNVPDYNNANWMLSTPPESALQILREKIVECGIILSKYWRARKNDILHTLSPILVWLHGCGISETFSGIKSRLLSTNRPSWPRRTRPLRPLACSSDRWPARSTSVPRRRLLSISPSRRWLPGLAAVGLSVKPAAAPGPTRRRLLRSPIRPSSSPPPCPWSTRSRTLLSRCLWSRSRRPSRPCTTSRPCRRGRWLQVYKWVLDWVQSLSTKNHCNC